ncbi:hypothetical protein Rhopal_001535-T1 [Rhodotorula paludigena]|uniref:SAC domain-containing protein n=1 Tax=Rhodotorula paludigena TaxID=86838 RepID=A0AAV5GDJ6_9BASI|nr:hypothetical protein Rhopal_001535-T1 [Rhodotorula paludigena]
MRVYLPGPRGGVLIEDTGYFLEILPHVKFAGVFDVHSYPPGSPNKPDLNLRMMPIDIVGCLGVVRVQRLTYLIVATLPVTSIGMEDVDVEVVRDCLFVCLDGPMHPPDVRDHAHPCYDLHQILTDGSIMYSKMQDLSSHLLSRIRVQQQRDAACFPTPRTDDAGATTAAHRLSEGTFEFVWNDYILAPLLQLRDTLDEKHKAEFNARSFILRVVQGFFGAAEVELPSGKVMLSVTSRREWGRAGTRFEKRGIDKYGYVANFAETETILRTADKIISFVQVRGSVPEKDHWTGHLKLSIAQPVQVVSLRPFMLHMHDLVRMYSAVHAFSLLSNAKDASLAAEGDLNDCYEALCTLGQRQDDILAKASTFERFDVSKRIMLSSGVAGMPKAIGKDVEPVLDRFGATVADIDSETGKYELQSEQQGVFRVNCRDCLDRSNLGEYSISAAALNKELSALGLPTLEQSDELNRVHRKLFSAFIRDGVVTPNQTIENLEAGRERHMQAALHDRQKNRATEVLTGQYENEEPTPVFNWVRPTTLTLDTISSWLPQAPAGLLGALPVVHAEAPTTPALTPTDSDSFSLPAHSP